MEPTITQSTLAAPSAKSVATPAPVDITKYNKLEFRRKFWKVLGAEISIFDPATDRLVGFIHMKAWKLREDIRLYTDKSMQTEIFHIKARQIIDFGATYDVFDSDTGRLITSLRRKALKSAFVRDHWDILDSAGNVTGSIQETSGTLALMRRWLTAIFELFDLVFMFILQTYDITTTNKAGQKLPAATIVHRRNPVVVRMSLDMSENQAQLYHRVIIAATAMLSIVDAIKNV